jgi:ABC transporter DrrB family efflux protein
MTTTQLDVASSGGAGRVFADWVTLSWRNLLAYIRIPEQVFFSTVQPIMFVLLFRYVFGGAIPVKNFNFEFVDYLMPGIFAQTVAFGAVSTATGLADDLGKGLIERFRSLPMAPSAVLVGRTTADLVRNVFVLFLMTGVGMLVGFRIHTNVLQYFAAFGIFLLFAYSLSWAFATIGLAAPNAETAQLMAFPILLPLTFASSAFVPVDSMKPDWLAAWARNQPVSVVIDAGRALLNGGPALSMSLKAIAWWGGILIVLAPFSVWRFKKTGLR